MKAYFGLLERLRVDDNGVRMVRIGAIFVALCMVLIAASVGAVLYFRLGFSAADSALIALGVLTALAIYNAVAGRRTDRAEVSDQMSDVARGSADLARQVAEFGRRLGAMESKVESAFDKAQSTAQPLATEIEELSRLVKQLAESVAQHEIALSQERGNVYSVPPAAAESSPSATTFAAPAAAPAAPIGRKIAAFDGLDQDAIVAAIRGAIDAQRIDLYLQPIVTLPQRKVRYYEAMSRLNAGNGEIVAAGDFLPYAEAGSLLPKLDSLSVLLEFIEANRAIAPSLVFEFTQNAVRNMGPMEHESLAALTERGFRFSMDNLSDLRVEPRELNARGFRFIKAPATLLLNRVGSATGNIHPADFSDLLGRHGIDLIAERIESESIVVDLLDYDVRFGQGFLFSPPRPVRAEALQGVAGDAGKSEPVKMEETAAPTGDTVAAARSGLAQFVRAGR